MIDEATSFQNCKHILKLSLGSLVFSNDSFQQLWTRTINLVIEEKRLLWREGYHILAPIYL